MIVLCCLKNTFFMLCALFGIFLYFLLVYWALNRALFRADPIDQQNHPINVIAIKNRSIGSSLVYYKFLVSCYVPTFWLGMSRSIGFWSRSRWSDGFADRSDRFWTMPDQVPSKTIKKYKNIPISLPNKTQSIKIVFVKQHSTIKRYSLLTNNCIVCDYVDCEVTPTACCVASAILLLAN